MKKFLLIICIFLLITGCNKEEKPEVEKIQIITEEEETKEVSISDYYSYVETINIEDSGEEEHFTVYKNVYLLEGNKYYYEYTEYGDVCGVWSSGSYEIKDNKLYLTEQYNGDCSNCYYTVNLNNYTFDILDDQLLSEDGEVLNKTTQTQIPNMDISKFNNCDKDVE